MLNGKVLSLVRFQMSGDLAIYKKDKFDSWKMGSNKVQVLTFKYSG